MFNNNSGDSPFDFYNKNKESFNEVQLEETPVVVEEVTSFQEQVVSPKASLLKNKFVLKGFWVLAVLTVVAISNPFWVFDSKEVKEFKTKLANNKVLNEKIWEFNKTLALYNTDLEQEKQTLKNIQEDWANTFKKVCWIQKQYNSLSLDKTKECSDIELETYLKDLTTNCKDFFKKDCSNKDKVLYIRSTNSNSSVVKTLEPSIKEEALNNDFSFEKLKEQIEKNKSKPITLNYVQGGKAFTLNMTPSQEEINSLKRDSKISVTWIEWHNTAVPVYAKETDGLYDKSVKENFKDENGKYLSWWNSLLEIYENHKVRLEAPYIWYHFIVLTDWTVLNTRPVDLIASWDLCWSKAMEGKKGCRSQKWLLTSENWNNFRFIHASFIWDWKPNEKQLVAMKELSKLMAEQFSFKLTPFSVYSHNEFSSSKDSKENFLYWIKGEELTDETVMISKALDAKREFIK